MENYMANYLPDMDWGSIMPVDPEMSTEPAPFNTDDDNFKKHLDIHNKRVPCEAGNPGERHCFKRFADNKARNRHYWVYHEAWAKENNIPIEKSFCEPCKSSFVRRDFLWRHIKKFHSKESEVNKGKRVIDDKHEMVEGDGEEYAWVCRLKDTE
ncbi:hypothetical protein CFAM422_010458 [Trichoderma lentiforme]|uniref:C2H2-type domain-containing protein n=1 Tax=Trichoderma lentiforme TaxID=1567552 RepID=A0A9P5CA93_9HYPO|nr:hypothetical protein CFAM422_010458 [Trichoderma lentiforme]